MSMTGPRQFFRLRSAPVVLNQSTTNGMPMVTLTGPPGVNYIIQSTTDQIQWTSLQTNTLPTSCVDYSADRTTTAPSWLTKHFENWDA